MAAQRARRASSRRRGAPLLDDRTLEVLEFPAILARLASQTSFSAGRALALALRPSTDMEEVTRRQRETAEAVALDRLGIGVSLAGAHDVRERAAAAQRGQVLSTAELTDVASLCRAATQAQRALTRVADEAPLLARIGAGFGELGPLRTLIEQTVDERGEVRDQASAELGQIRRELQSAHGRLQQRMNALLNSTALRNALQDAIIVMRDGRYVLPVKADFRGAVRGVVHDTSASGATLYIEPLAVVDLGNAWRELQVQERHEVERILREVSAAVGELEADIRDAVERLAAIDVAQAKARLAGALGGRELAVRGARIGWLVDAPAELRLVDARHPLLSGDVVPTSLRVGGDFDALLITGPNTGGKTVALKTAGLLCLMALAGLPLPANTGTQIPVYASIFADIGDEQSIEQSLSTFSGHMTAVIDIIERAGRRSLVLLDELGAGTDPTEGAALGVAIVERLVGAGVALIATTHHSELKVYAHKAERVMNASVEFDLSTLRPTYRLSIGLPGQSNALSIARNLGMPLDVIERAREGLSHGEREMEALLGDLREQLATAEVRAEQAARAAAEATALRSEVQRERDAFASDVTRLREDARAQVRRELAELERLVERTKREVEAARLEQARADLERAKEVASELAPAPEPERHEVTNGPIDVYPGATVWLRGMSSPGEALSEPDERGEFEVQLGALRTRVRIEQVLRTGAPIPAERTRMAVATVLDVGDSIEVRGQTIDEALPRVEEFLDHAARSGRARVLLIHGKGTGTLRRAVRELLDRHPLVDRYETADRAEGGEGVTVAHLQTV